MKRILCAALTVCMMLSCIFAASAATADLSDEGKTVAEYGDWIIEKIENDTQWSLDEYKGTDEEVIIPRIINNVIVSKIDDHCFANNTNITSVITSSPLWTVGEYAFIDCTALMYFECNYALRTIKTGAFSGTSALKEINLETSVITEVMPHTFMNSGIEVIQLPETCAKLGEYSFGQCYKLGRILIPDSVTEIADTAFYGDENLVIYCSTGSCAHEYAESKGIDYVLTDEPQEVSFILGDADGDSKITILDATKIQRLLAALVTDDDGMISLRGDTDGNGLDILDATRIQRWLAGFTTDEQIGTEVTGQIYISF